LIEILTGGEEEGGEEIQSMRLSCEDQKREKEKAYLSLSLPDRKKREGRKGERTSSPSKKPYYLLTLHTVFKG